MNGGLNPNSKDPRVPVDPIDQLLWSHVTGELSPGERDQVDRLLEQPAIQARCREFEQVWRALRSLGRISLPADFPIELSAKLADDRLDCELLSAASARLAPRQTNESVSALIDGALTDRERAELKERFAADPALRAELRDLRQVVDALRSLPTARAPETLLADVLSRLTREARSKGDAPAVKGEILSAYVDGELSERAGLAVEQRLKQVASAANKVQALRNVKTILGTLPKVKAPAGHLSEILHRVAESAPVPNTPRKSNGFGHDAGRMAAALVGALLLVAVPAEVLRRTRSPQLPLEQASLATRPTSASLRDRLRPQFDRLYDRLEHPPSEPLLNLAEPEQKGANVAGIDFAADLPAEPASSSDAGLPLDALREVLQDIQPGELVSLNEREVRLVCVDVKKVAERIHVILADHAIPNFSNDLSTGGESKATEAGAGRLYVIDFSAPAAELSSAFADLAHAERQMPLIERVAVQANKASKGGKQVAVNERPLAPGTRPLARVDSATKSLERFDDALGKSDVAVANVTPTPKAPAPAAEHLAEEKVAQMQPAWPANKYQGPVRVVIVLESAKRG